MTPHTAGFVPRLIAVVENGHVKLLPIAEPNWQQLWGTGPYWASNAVVHAPPATTRTNVGLSSSTPVHVKTEGGPSLVGPIVAAAVGAFLASLLAHWLSNIRENNAIKRMETKERVEQMEIVAHELRNLSTAMVPLIHAADISALVAEAKSFGNQFAAIMTQTGHLIPLIHDDRDLLDALQDSVIGLMAVSSEAHSVVSQLDDETRLDAPIEPKSRKRLRGTMRAAQTSIMGFEGLVHRRRGGVPELMDRPGVAPWRERMATVINQFDDDDDEDGSEAASPPTA